MKKQAFALIVLASFLAASAPLAAFATTSPSFTALETVANAAVGADTQTSTVATPTANLSASTTPAITFAGGVTEVKANSTFTFTGLPGNGEVFDIGECNMTFSNAGDDTDDTTCAGGVTISRTTATGGAGTPRTAAQIAAVIRTVTGITDTFNNHGALTVSGSGATVTFTTTGTEAGTTGISLMSTSPITVGASQNGVIGVAATASITVPAGIIANSADHSISIDGVTINLGTTAQTAAQLAAVIAAATFTSGTNYGLGAYTVTNPSGATVTFTKGTKGATGNGSVTTADASYGTRAQISTVTPVAVGIGDVFTITVNSTTYTFTATAATVKNVVEGLQPLVDADTAVVCTEDDTAVTCTAATPGAAFTISSTATNYVGAAQQATFTPANQDNRSIFQLTVNGTNYVVYAANSSKEIVENLTAQLGADASLTCTEDDVAITCTANTPGTTFIYVTKVSESNSGSGGGHSGGSSSSSVAPANTSTANLQATIDSLRTKLASLLAQMGGTSVTTTPTGSIFSRDLTFGSTADDVKSLQMYLNAHGAVIATTGPGSSGHETTSFGPGTRTALAKFQAANGITPASGYCGPKTRAYLAAH